MIELLAPAGNPEALRGAVYAGADAVYFGAQTFNARAEAGNFGPDELERAFSFCRTYGVKAYITLNTLVSDRELPDALALIDGLCALGGPDALIVQDLGLAAALHRRYPALPLHASTQMGFHSTLAVPLLRERGFTRVVLAREMRRGDVDAVAAAGLETELFAHGALCVCQSGGCLMSALIGGRSGNRGACAQPCRLPYRAPNAYPLSLKDLCLASHIPALLQSGVTSLKLEGRMKSAEYVYAVTKIYRRLLDERRAAAPAELDELAAVFSRSGFTDGYFAGRVGKSMFGVRTEADKARTRAAAVRIEKRRIPASLALTVTAGAPAMLTASSGGVSVTVRGDVPSPALSRPLEADALRARMEKSGNTPFAVEDCAVTLDDGLFLPVDRQNALRNDALGALERRLDDARRQDYGAPAADIVPAADSAPAPAARPRARGLVLRFDNTIPDAALLRALAPAAVRIDLPLHALPERLPCDASLCSAVLPRVVFDSDVADVRRLLAAAKARGVRQVTLPSAALLPLCEGFVLHGDYTLNVYNTRTLAELAGMGFDSVFLSPEAKAAAFRNAGGAAREILFYGRAPVMHTEACILQNLRPCGPSDGCRGLLTDRTGAQFPILREFRHRNTLYNAVPTCLFDRRDRLEGCADLFCLLFTVEREAEVRRLVDCAQRGENPLQAFTRMYV